MLVGILSSSHPHILRLMSSRCLLVSSHPHFLISLRLCTPGACWYSCTLTSLGSCTPSACKFPCTSHPHSLTFMYCGCLLVSSHPHILRFQCLYLFRKLESDKTMVLTKKKLPLWKQIMALKIFWQNSTFITKIDCIMWSRNNCSCSFNCYFNSKLLSYY